MKAYKAWDTLDDDNWSTIVFAENARKAKTIAMSTDLLGDSNFINIRIKREKTADCLYKGKSEIDWEDEETRLALVRDFNWECYEPSWECDTCKAKEFCGWHNGDEDEPE